MDIDAEKFNDGLKQEYGSDFFEKLNEELAETSAKVIAEMRLREVELDALIAAGERDTDKMDSVMNWLFYFENDSLAEKIIRKYIAYLATFNPSYAQNRLDYLEETFGYKSNIVYAAGLMASAFGAMRLGCTECSSQFAQLLEIVKSGRNWKEKVAIFIHNASKNTRCSVPELMTMLNDNVRQLMTTPQEKWWQRWMDYVMDNDADSTHPMTDAEADEITSLIYKINS